MDNILASRSQEIKQMKFLTQSYRHADIILADPRYAPIYKEVLDALTAISDQDIMGMYIAKKTDKSMSISKAINALIRGRLESVGWDAESPIFQEPEYSDKTWRLDFAKAPISIEVSFNHGEAIAWNLVKPVLASELNHVKKAIQTEVGIMITATEALKNAGAFDSAVGSYEKAIRYLIPMRSMLTVPIMMIGLEAPETFYIQKNSKNSAERATFVLIDNK